MKAENKQAKEWCCNYVSGRCVGYSFRKDPEEKGGFIHFKDLEHNGECHQEKGCNFFRAYVAPGIHPIKKNKRVQQ